MSALTSEQVTLKAIDWLRAANVRYMVVGALAVDIYGRPRLTEDTDIAVPVFISLRTESQINRFIYSAIDYGFPVSPVEIREAIKKTEKLVFKLPDARFRVEFFLVKSTPYNIEAFKRRRYKQILGKRIYFASPEDIILHKSTRMHPKDAEDIKAILLRQRKNLDFAYIKRWSREMETYDELMRITDEVF